MSDIAMCEGQAKQGVVFIDKVFEIVYVESCLWISFMSDIAMCVGQAKQGVIFKGNEIIRVYDKKVVMYKVWPFYVFQEFGYKYGNLRVYDK